MADPFEQEGGGLPDFLRDPFGIPKRRWRWITLGGLLGAAVGAFLITRWEPSYEAVASILVTSQQIPEEFIQTTVPEDPFSRLNAMVSQVLSRQKLSALIDEFDLFEKERQELMIFLTPVVITKPHDLELLTRQEVLALDLINEAFFEKHILHDGVPSEEKRLRVVRKGSPDLDE